MTDGLKDAHREAIIAALAANDRVERAVLFGSRATGTNTVSSDVDIALFGARLTLTDQARLAAALDEIPMAQSVDLLLYESLQDGTLREHIRRQGVEWYARPARDDGRDAASGSLGQLDYLPPGWERSTLGAACERAGGNIQTGPFGSQLHASDYRPSGIPSIMPQNLGDNRVIAEGIARIGDSDASRLRRYLVRQGDIVYSRRGDVEKRALIGPREDGWLCGTGCLRVRLGKNGVDPRYASYYLGHPAVREWIVRHAHGATMPNLNTAILSACPFVIPPLSEQRAIAGILGTLDDKIELNRRMNATLEAMARALFRSWFVDFDPVRAKMEGRDTGLPKEIADLFPDRLVDSEHGALPSGWCRESISTLAKVVYGAPFSSSQFRTDGRGIPLIRIRDLRTHAPGVSTEEQHRNGHLIVSGDIVVGMDGEFRLHVWKGPASWLNQRVCHFEPREGVPVCYLAEALKEPLALFESGKVGTTVIHLGKADIDTFLLLNPGEQVLGVFRDLCGPLVHLQVLRALEGRVLAEIRDLLLPKLVSGEFRVTGLEPASGRDDHPAPVGIHGA